MRKLIHITIGIVRDHHTTLLLGVVAATFSLGLASGAFGADLLPVYNEAGIVTTLRVVNATDAAIALPRPCEMSTCTHPTLAAHDFKVFPTSGSGWVISPFDPALSVESEFVTPVGARLRVGPCQPVESAWFYDLIPPGTSDYNSGIFVAAVDRDAVVSAGGAQVSVPLGTAAILPNTAAVAHLVTTLGSGRVCTFSYGNHHITGSLFVVPAR